MASKPSGNSLWPKEHGAYGQIAFPLLTAFLVAGVSTAGLLTAAAALGAFLSHEPAAVLLGVRGARARRELRRQAIRWLTGWLALAAAAGGAAILAMDPAVRWSLAFPVVPAIALAFLTVKGREKSTAGEVATALAFSAAAVPIALGAGARMSTAAAVAIPFALLFVASTLAVRVVILRVRGGGDPAATATTRRAALSLSVAAPAALAGAAAVDLLSASVLIAAAPGLLTAALIAARPPAAARLRAVGWTLVAVSVVTAAIVVAVT